MTFTEENLEMDIPDVVGGGSFDGASHGLNRCMKAVDFVIELADRYLFIELKDPQHPSATPASRDEFIRRLNAGQLDDDLKYRYRDSFLYEWASGRADKPIDYLVLIALDALDEAQLLARTEYLTRSLPQRGPDDQLWRRELVRACGVFNLESWNRNMARYPVHRIGTPRASAGAAP